MTNTDSAEYGLVNHVPSGEVYVMRWHDGAAHGPLHASEHLAALENATELEFDPDNTEWAKDQEWQPHDLDNRCYGCNG